LAKERTEALDGIKGEVGELACCWSAGEAGGRAEKVMEFDEVKFGRSK
jgi:hypothetical protein